MPAEAFKGHDGFSRMPMILSSWPKGIDLAHYRVQMTLVNL